VPAAEAMNAEGASDGTRRTQTTVSDRQTGLNSLDIGEVGVGDGDDTLSKCNMSTCPLQGEARNVYISFGAVNDALSRTKCLIMEHAVEPSQ